MINRCVLIRSDESLFNHLREKLQDYLEPGDNVAVKLHMGEPGNPFFIKSSFVKEIVESLKEIGLHPFIFDTPVVYRSPRNNAESYLKVAADHGYSKDELGAPVVISNDSIPIEGEFMTYNAASVTLEADGVLLLSHVKGHLACGMGGAVKNVGMGCMSKETKGAIHEGGKPVYGDGCTQCNSCVDNCPTGNIRLNEKRPYFDRTWCPGCSNCVIVCPENCISPRLAKFDDLIGEAAALAHSRMKKVYAVNVLKNISKLCDCVADAGPIILDDIGYICGENMISVDAASLEAVKEASGRDDLFEEHNLHSPWDHIRAAARSMNESTDVTIEEIT